MSGLGKSGQVNLDQIKLSHVGVGQIELIGQAKLGLVKVDRSSQKIFGPKIFWPKIFLDQKFL